MQLLFDSDWREAYCILRKMRKLRIGCVNAQDVHKILSHCAIYVQDLRKIVLISSMNNIGARFVQDCTYFPNAQYMRKIVLISTMCILISTMCNICTRFAQDCTYFPNAQYMRKICARLYLFPQCAIYVQDLHKIVLLSPMCNICARFVQDCTSLPM